MPAAVALAAWAWAAMARAAMSMLASVACPNPKTCEASVASWLAQLEAFWALLALLCATCDAFPPEPGVDEPSEPDSGSPGSWTLPETEMSATTSFSSNAAARPTSPEAAVASTSRRMAASGSTYRGRRIPSRPRPALDAAVPGTNDDMIGKPFLVFQRPGTGVSLHASAGGINAREIQAEAEWACGSASFGAVMGGLGGRGASG